MRRARLGGLLLASVVVALPSVIAGAPAPIGVDVIHLTVRVGEDIGLPYRSNVTHIEIGAREILVPIGSNLERFGFRCVKVGESAVVIEEKDGTKTSYLIECIPGFTEFAPSPGGAADESRRFSTGNNTKVIQVDCKNPVSCDIANRGRDGAFDVRCVGKGSGEVDYIYEPILDKQPAGGTILIGGKLRARCPRD